MPGVCGTVTLCRLYVRTQKSGRGTEKNVKKWIIVMQNNNNYAYGFGHI